MGFCQHLLFSTAPRPGHGGSGKEIIAQCLLYPEPSYPCGPEGIREAKKKDFKNWPLCINQGIKILSEMETSVSQSGSIVVQRAEHRTTQGRMHQPVLRLGWRPGRLGICSCCHQILTRSLSYVTVAYKFMVPPRTYRLVKTQPNPHTSTLEC